MASPSSLMVNQLLKLFVLRLLLKSNVFQKSMASVIVGNRKDSQSYTDVAEVEVHELNANPDCKRDLNLGPRANHDSSNHQATKKENTLAGNRTGPKSRIAPAIANSIAPLDPPKIWSMVFNNLQYQLLMTKQGTKS
ncbi:hypothetical protein H5410_048752 [Solanum commersonii]|uniref:Uncharacterized protein n=1 Tax=Solanum commersonii TaxID=4109 RepID=A0A9J5XMN4_SOLCO|nr:hypothetical protein H5410_048752 [Solanum commersonii]